MMVNQVEVSRRYIDHTLYFFSNKSLSTRFCKRRECKNANSKVNALLQIQLKGCMRCVAYFRMMMILGLKIGRIDVYAISRIHRLIASRDHAIPSFDVMAFTECVQCVAPNSENWN